MYIGPYVWKKLLPVFLHYILLKERILSNDLWQFDQKFIKENYSNQGLQRGIGVDWTKEGKKLRAFNIVTFKNDFS